MSLNVNKEEQELFARLCEAESYLSGSEADSIGVYKEKRLHRILKNTIAPNTCCHEVAVGRYVADIKEGEWICEVQTKSLAPLRNKLEYYLEHTESHICVVHPVLVKKTIIRASRESGEVLSVRRSPKNPNIYKELAALYPIARCLTSPRLSLRLMLVEAEEYRYSERVRHRKSGAFDSELFPTALVGSYDFESIEDYAELLPSRESGEYTAKDFEKAFKLHGRDLYSALNVFSALGLLTRQKNGSRVKYLYS